MGRALKYIGYILIITSIILFSGLLQPISPTQPSPLQSTVPQFAWTFQVIDITPGSPTYNALIPTATMCYAVTCTTGGSGTITTTYPSGTLMVTAPNYQTFIQPGTFSNGVGANFYLVKCGSTVPPAYAAFTIACGQQVPTNPLNYYLAIAILAVGVYLWWIGRR